MREVRLKFDHPNYPYFDRIAYIISEDIQINTIDFSNVLWSVSKILIDSNLLFYIYYIYTVIKFQNLTTTLTLIFSSLL